MEGWNTGIAKALRKVSRLQSAKTGIFYPSLGTRKSHHSVPTFLDFVSVILALNTKECLVRTPPQRLHIAFSLSRISSLTSRGGTTVQEGGKNINKLSLLALQHLPG